jgi:hypothetical protein
MTLGWRCRSATGKECSRLSHESAFTTRLLHESSRVELGHEVTDRPDPEQALADRQERRLALAVKIHDNNYHKGGMSVSSVTQLGTGAPIRRVCSLLRGVRTWHRTSAQPSRITTW